MVMVDIEMMHGYLDCGQSWHEIISSGPQRPRVYLRLLVQSPLQVSQLVLKNLLLLLQLFHIVRCYLQIHYHHVTHNCHHMVHCHCVLHPPVITQYNCHHLVHPTVSTLYTQLSAHGTPNSQHMVHSTVITWYTQQSAQGTLNCHHVVHPAVIMWYTQLSSHGTPIIQHMLSCDSRKCHHMVHPIVIMWYIRLSLYTQMSSHGTTNCY